MSLCVFPSSANMPVGWCLLVLIKCCSESVFEQTKSHLKTLDPVLSYLDRAVTVGVARWSAVMEIIVPLLEAWLSGSRPPRGDWRLVWRFKAVYCLLTLHKHILTAAWCTWAGIPFLRRDHPSLGNIPLSIQKYWCIIFMEIYNNRLSLRHKEGIWVKKWWWPYIQGIPCYCGM